mmetsp:Transcript_43842/g.95453  ORF Transcript_43842/g.95453 Transcript_43842/m.95453 type:complete len:297 (+) Transcript_43842:461-1351(+)
MHTEDGQTAACIRQIHAHKAVEAARSKQSLVENLRPVGGANNDHRLARTGVQTIHGRQHLVQRLFCFLVSSGPEEVATSACTQCVNLVDEDDARRLLLGALEEASDSCCTTAYEEFHELRGGHAHKRHARLCGAGTCQERLARSRGPDEENPARHAGSEYRVGARVRQHIHHLHDLYLGLVHAGHIDKACGQGLGAVRLALHQLAPRVAPGLAAAPAGHPLQHAEDHEEIGCHAGEGEEEVRAVGSALRKNGDPGLSESLPDLLSHVMCPRGPARHVASAVHRENALRGSQHGLLD